MHDNKTVLRGSGNEQGASDFFALITDIFSFVPTIFQPYHRLDLPHFPSHLLVQMDKGACKSVYYSDAQVCRYTRRVGRV